MTVGALRTAYRDTPVALRAGASIITTLCFVCVKVQSLRLWQQEQNAFSLTEAAAQRKPAASHLLGNTSMENVTDSLFGTTYLTHGAALQLPRKVPLRIEPKSYFANERTFLAWLHMAVTMGGIITALSSFSVATENEAKRTPGSGPVTQKTTEAIQLLLLPISIGMVAYALFTFYWRSRCMERKQMGFFNDFVGPVVLCVLIMLSLATIMMLSIRDFFR